jgi:hypothetical protein
MLNMCTSHPVVVMDNRDNGMTNNNQEGWIQKTTTMAEEGTALEGPPSRGPTS